jgi:DNA-binding response OmpR family regulator
MSAAAESVALVADDDGVIRRMLTMLLERLGYQVLLAGDGGQALRLAIAHQPRLIFLDARMPPPDGFEVCRLLREQVPAERAPVIFMVTAAGQESDRRLAATVGVDEFLTKPFSPSKLTARLQQLSKEAIR